MCFIFSNTWIEVLDCFFVKFLFLYVLCCFYQIDGLPTCTYWRYRLIYIPRLDFIVLNFLLCKITASSHQRLVKELSLSWMHNFIMFAFHHLEISPTIWEINPLFDAGKCGWWISQIDLLFLFNFHIGVTVYRTWIPSKSDWWLIWLIVKILSLLRQQLSIVLTIYRCKITIPVITS